MKNYGPKSCHLLLKIYLAKNKDPSADRSERGRKEEKGKVRDKTKVVVYRVPHNAAAQIYDYKEKEAR